MFVPIKHVAEMLHVHHTTIWRWAKASGLKVKTSPSGQMIPVVAFLNWMVRHQKLPLPATQEERGARIPCKGNGQKS